PDVARQQLGRVAAARAELGDAHAWGDAPENEQLLGMSSGVECAVGGRAVGRGNGVVGRGRDHRWRGLRWPRPAGGNGAEKRYGDDGSQGCERHGVSLYAVDRSVQWIARSGLPVPQEATRARRDGPAAGARAPASCREWVEPALACRYEFTRAK